MGPAGRARDRAHHRKVVQKIIITRVVDLDFGGVGFRKLDEASVWESKAMGVVAIIQNGVWTSVDDGQPPANQRPYTHVVDPHASDIDRIVAHLAEVIRVAQNLSPEDARRARDFFHAAWGMLSATTYLAERDQKQFERALRERPLRG